MASESEIRSAHSRAIGGQRKRCQIGKNCSAACINRQDACLVELPVSPSQETARLRNRLQERGDMQPKMPPLTPQMRGDLREDIEDGIYKAIRRGDIHTSGSESQKEYNSWRDKAKEFNKEIVRQGLENSIKPINVPVSVEKVNKVIGNYNNARLALFKDMEKALADGDPDKFERIERRRERMRDKIGIRIGESSVDQKNLDTIALRKYTEARLGLYVRLEKLAKGGNKRAYDKLSDKLNKLDDWASRRLGVDNPRDKGRIWEAYKSTRTSQKVQKIRDEAWKISQSLKDLARKGRRDQYNKLENKLARIESILKSKFEPDRAVFEKGKLWAQGREQKIRGQYNKLMGRLKASMEKAATRKNREGYDRLERRLLKLQDHFKPILGIPDNAILKKGDLWEKTRLTQDKNRFYEIRYKITEKMKDAVRRRDRATYDRLENRLLRLETQIPDEIKSSYYRPTEKGGIWREERQFQYNRVRNSIIDRMDRVARSNNRQLYDSLEERLAKLQRAGGYQEHIYSKGEIWKKVQFEVRKERYIGVRESIISEMKRAIVNDDRNAYMKAESKLISLKDKAANRFEDYELKYYGRDRLWNTMYSNSELKRMQEKLGYNVHVSGDMGEGNLLTFVKGQRLTIDYSPSTLTFQVNGDYSANDSLPRATRYAILKETRRQFDALFRDIIEDGTELSVQPYSGDDRYEKRVKEYQRMGFSPPDQGNMYGRVSNGRIVPSDMYDYNAYHNGGGYGYDDDYED